MNNLDKYFWQTIRNNSYSILPDHTPTSLTADLFVHLGSRDPELRDRIAMSTTLYAVCVYKL